MTPVVTGLLSRVDREAGLDFYDFRVEVRNDGPKVIHEFAIEVEVPQRHMENAGSYSANVKARKPDTYLFRHTQDSFREFALYPGTSYPVFSLGFIVKRDHYLQGVTEAITVYLYTGDELVAKEPYPINDMLSAERIEQVFGPRIAALKKIYKVARDFYGPEADLTAEIVFVSEGPGEGKRSANLGENAYTLCKALAGERWILFENENAMIVRLTKEGVLKAL